ncbi:hypothetical protein WH297_02995 [Ochrobactrum vermis]|uniref:Secreted protein n=1 Tax=Ochrobactrum vermis TaxID=1827297 RepID=A0ABU8P8X3_9HYPH|nr:hypothetical protein [Ochrobactrum vermis]
MRLFYAVLALAVLSYANVAPAAGLNGNLGTECRRIPIQGTGASDTVTRPSWAMPLWNSPSVPASQRSQRAIVYPQAVPSPQLYRYDCTPTPAEPNAVPRADFSGQ